MTFLTVWSMLFPVEIIRQNIPFYIAHKEYYGLSPIDFLTDDIGRGGSYMAFDKVHVKNNLTHRLGQSDQMKWLSK